MPYLQYLPSLSTNKRDSHTAYYGLVRPVDDPIWQSIFPPNGFGCKCRTKQLTKEQAQKILDEQAEKGIVYDIETEQVKHPLTGEMVSTPKGVHFSFNHNHDRLSAMLKLAEERHGVLFAKDIADTVVMDDIAERFLSHWLGSNIFGHQQAFKEMSDVVNEYGLSELEFMAVYHYTYGGQSWL